MENKVLVVETSSDLDEAVLIAITKLFNKKFGADASEAKLVKNAHIFGGIEVSYGDYKFLIGDDIKDFMQAKEEYLLIEVNHELTSVEIEKYMEYAKSRLIVEGNVKSKVVVNSEMIGGIKIRYKDKELDLSLDNLIDKAFSKI